MFLETAPLWSVTFKLSDYPPMPVAGWVMLGLGLVFFMLLFVLRGVKFSTLLTMLALLAYYPGLYGLYVYLHNLGDTQPGKMTLVLLQVMGDPDTKQGLERNWLIACGILGGSFFVCMLESAINFRRKPQHRYDEDSPVVEVAPVAPPPLPRKAPPPPRGMSRPAAAVPPVPRKPPRPPAPPSPHKNPFDFT
jgi:hypothetical protein